MPYLYQTHEGNENIRKELGKLGTMGPEFAEGDISRAEKMELHASKFEDPGPDFMEYHLFDSDGNHIVMKKTIGY